MRISIGPAVLVVLLGLGACSSQDTDSRAREAGRKARHAADELDQKSKEAARRAEEAAKKANREIKRVAGEARKGWKEGGKDEPRDER